MINLTGLNINYSENDMLLGVHILVEKYTFKINVIYHHRGSTCDPSGILIQVLLTSNTQSFYDK